MKKLFALTAIVALLGVGACTDTDVAHLQSYGNSAHITCYSGGKVIVDDNSTGKLLNANGSDGYEYMSKTTGKLHQVSGDCVVVY